MKKYLQMYAFLLAFLAFMPFVTQAQPGRIQYAFVIFETNVTKEGVETTDENPQEQRTYVSSVVAFPEEDPSVFRNASKIADDYFTATVVDPSREKRIVHQYYDDAIKINNRVVYNLSTRAEVEALRAKVLEEMKERSSNVFTFTWTRTGKLEGLKTSNPILFFRHPEEPLYVPEETAPIPPTPPVTTPPMAPVIPVVPVPAPPVVVQAPIVPKIDIAPKAPTTIVKPATPKKAVVKTPVTAKKTLAKVNSQPKKVVKKNVQKKALPAPVH
ncbi:hypothetical protein EON83_29410 [bacterium]|nr:MAG: hypothetical protein EON83_29410 [bacterium]